MMLINKRVKAVQNFLYTIGFYSEELPSEYYVKNMSVFKNKVISKTNVIPFRYTMNKDENIENRRIISIPEFGSYITAVKSLTNGEVLKNIIKDNIKNSNSLSKVFTKDDEIRSFSNPYNVNSSTKGDDVSTLKDTFIKNTLIKFSKSSGSVGILKLDIANFYGSFYTHNISCIGNGYKWAQENYERKSGSVDPYYKSLTKLDEGIRAMNMNRTHGILVGPRINYIIAEGLLTTIDKELSDKLNDLKDNNVSFIRFMDDYDIFIDNDEVISRVKYIFTDVLEKYGLSLNENKTEYKKFPYYNYKDFSKKLENKDQNITPIDLLNLYSELNEQ